MSIEAYPKAQPMPLPFVYPRELPSNCVFFLDMQDGLAAVGSNNLVRFDSSDPKSIDNMLDAGNVTFVNDIPGWNGGLRYNAEAVAAYGRWIASTLEAGKTYVASAYVLMDDGSAPVPGLHASASADFSFIVTNEPAVTSITVTHIGSNIYRASARHAVGVPSSINGIYRYAVQSGKGFKCSGFMINEGTALLDYAPGYTPSRGSLITDHAQLSRKWTNTGGVWVVDGNLLAWQGDGVDDKISWGSDLVGTGDTTFEAVIKPSGWGGGGFGHIISNNKFAVILLNSNLRVYSNFVNMAQSAAGSIALNRRYHIVVTRKSDGKASIYINGKLSGSPDQNSGAPQAGGAVTIGNYEDGTRSFAGTLGYPLALYRGIWSAQDVAARYAEVAALYGLAG